MRLEAVEDVVMEAAAPPAAVPRPPRPSEGPPPPEEASPPAFDTPTVASAAPAEADVATPSMLGRGAWALVDQAVFSATNWLMQVLLAAWLPTEAAYGTFVVAFSWFLLLGTIHNTLLIEPMLVFGPERYRRRLRRYLGVLCTACIAVGLASSAVLVAAGFGYRFAGSGDAAVDLWSMALAAPCILLLWLTRRACYVRLDPRRAAIAGIAYVAVMVGGMAALRMSGHFNVPTVMAVLAASSLIAAAWLARSERVVLPRSTRDAVVRVATMDHLRYGLWAVPTGLVLYIPAEIYYFLLPGVVGFEASGALRAIFNLFLPLIMFAAALSGLLLPMLVKAREPAQLRKLMVVSMLLLAGVPLGWWLFVGVLHEPILGLVYPGRFADDGWLVWLVGLQPVLFGWQNVVHAYLRSRQHVRPVFVASVVSGALSMAVGIPLMYGYGLLGAAVAALIAMGVNAAMSTAYAYRAAAVSKGERLGERR